MTGDLRLEYATGKLISVDAECDRLPGQAFAVAMTLSDGTGELDQVVYRCPVEGPVAEWVAKNVLPAIEDIAINCADYAGLLFNLREQYFTWAEGGTPLLAHVAWPVEARLLLDLLPGEDIWAGPYPLIDVSMALLMKGYNPLSVDDYLREHGLPVPTGSPHHPLYDARAAERCFRHLMTAPGTR